MTKEKEIAIMMSWGMTKNDAKQNLKNGSLIYDDIEDWIKSLKDCDCYEGETAEGARAGDYADIFVTEYEGKEYLLEIHV